MRGHHGKKVRREESPPPVPSTPVTSPKDPILGSAFINSLPAAQAQSPPHQAPSLQPEVIEIIDYEEEESLVDRLDGM